MKLTESDQAVLRGDYGKAAALALQLVVAVAEAQGAERLIDIEAAHIDGCLFHGQAGLDFAERLVSTGGTVAVPTTLNVASLDLLHPDLYRGDPETASSARALMDAYVAMGCQPTWTCAPYQLSRRPGFGQQIAWGESNAIVFANSVLGARTERYGDFMDIACAIAGRAPQFGLHTDEGRLAKLVLELDVPDQVLDGDVVYPLLGHVIGNAAGTTVPAVLGLDDRATEDRLKAVGAAAASSGAVAMFHAVGVTPEAPTLEEATGGIDYPREVIDMDDLREARRELGPANEGLAAVSVGTPHMSLTELGRLAEMVKGQVSHVPFYVNTARGVIGRAGAPLIEALERFGATVVTDTCTYITPIMDEISGAVMTDSGKWAFYAPANLGVSVAFGSLRDCVASAVNGEITWIDEWS